jgi:hypothetical protein
VRTDDGRGNRTFDEWASDWLATQQTRAALGKLKQRTADDYGNVLNRYVLPELGTLAIADVDTLTIEQFMARLSVRKTPSGAPLHPKTIKHAWNALGWVLAYASRKEATEVNPVDKSEFSSERVATGWPKASKRLATQLPAFAAGIVIGGPKPPKW